MNELRKDYILDRWVIIAAGRGKRPHQFAAKQESNAVDFCFFCAGNEHTTPPEISRVEENGKWVIRVFPNKFPAVMAEGNPAIQTHNQFYTFSSAFGIHEVVTESPSHNDQIGDLSQHRIKQLLQVYNQRINALSKQSGISYVLVFKNQGKEAGTSLVHTHTQIAAMNKVPPLVQEEVAANKVGCKYCQIIQSEKDSYRRIMENSCISFTPYASRFPFEAWIFPKRHVRTLDDLNDIELEDLAAQMKHIFLKLKEINAPFNFYLHYAPAGEDLHFHIEIAPRLATWAGLEYGSNIIVNVMPPEDAAKFYRGESQ
jgi:UDPglucose--hexose-1-phosphate uridylyltransferase